MASRFLLHEMADKAHLVLDLRDDSTLVTFGGLPQRVTISAGGYNLVLTCIS